MIIIIPLGEIGNKLYGTDPHVMKPSVVTNGKKAINIFISRTVPVRS